MTDFVTIHTENRVRTITFNRADKKNALTYEMYEVVDQAMRDADKDPDIRAVLITGSGDSFTAGNDLIDFRDRPPISPDAPVLRFLDCLASIETPLVIAVNGTAVGVGLTMLLHADLAFASETAQFSAPFVDLALVPEAASSLLLPQRIGRALAGDIFFTGRVLNAQEALGAGLVSRVLPSDALFEAARREAEKLARKAPVAVKSTKKLMRPDVAVIRAQMQAEGACFSAQLQSPELLEAVTAFMQKRPPVFD